MNGRAWFLIVLTIITGATYAYLLWQGAGLSTDDPAQNPFDTRVLGYSLDEAQSYLANLRLDQVELYLGKVRLLDTAFPVLFFFWLLLMTWVLTEGIHPWSRMMLLMPAGGYLLMDLGENALVAEMLRSGVAVAPEIVSMASAYTVSKFILFTISVAVIGVLWGRRRFSG